MQGANVSFDYHPLPHGKNPPRNLYFQAGFPQKKLVWALFTGCSHTEALPSPKDYKGWECSPSLLIFFK